MDEIVKGTLFFEKAKRKWQIEFFNARKNRQSTVDCDAVQLSADIPKNEDAKLEVGFERDPRYGNPLKVRPAGQRYQPSAASNVRAQKETESVSNLQFHNPYNFVPAPERKASKELGDLGDRTPSGHDCYRSPLFSGKLRVQLKVVTPLLIPDTARVKEHKYREKKAVKIHNSFPPRIGMDGRPHLAVTSVKGMLRFAYEAITNSRLSVFGEHDEPLSYYMERVKCKHKFAPARLLQKQLKPAWKLIELSPADRVFGWVNQNGQGAYRGQLRLGVIECKTPKEQAIKYLTEDSELQNKELGLPLSILGAPKPQQGRFYVAEDTTGKAQPPGRNNEDAGYNRNDKGLRGRKVYPHHANLPDDYWHNPTGPSLETSKKEQGFYKEYRRRRSYKNEEPKEQRDNQNRSVQAWVERGTKFEFDIHFINLSGVELGALLWLLKLNDGKNEPDHFFRLGGGKPLGFGSVTLELKGCDVRDGAGWREYYECLSAADERDYGADNSFIVRDEGNRDKSGAEQLVKAYQAAVREAYKDAVPNDSRNGSLKTVPDKLPAFEQISFIAAFLRAATGFETNLPIHYPRARHPDEQGEPIHPAPHADGLAYEWFVENNRRERQYSLPDLEADEGLPIWDKR